MKTLILSAAATLALTGAALADQYNGNVSPAQFAANLFAQSHSEGDGPRTVPSLENGDVVVATSNADTTAFALRHFAQDHESGDGPRRIYAGAGSSDALVSTKNASLAAFAAEKLANGPEDDR